jgi:CRISPR/Cas system-associated exonuclease Cas4 (RecB family)
MSLENLDPAWKGRYGWSVSSGRLWQTCRRAFYYRYVASWQSTTGASARNRLYQMKDLTPLAALEGRLVHDSVENLIQQHRLGRLLRAAPAQEQYSGLVGRYKQMARDLVAEAYNGLAVQEKYFDLILEDGRAQIANFVKIVWPNLADLEYLSHEQFENFVVGGVKVNVKVDYVTKSPDGKIVVTDWKTGEERREENELQLAVYGMWASSKYEVPLNLVMLELAYLKTGDSRPVKLDEEAIADAKEAILAGSAEVLAADKLEDFVTNPSPDRCIACPFARVCPDGTQVLDDYIAVSVRKTVAKLSKKEVSAT